MKHGHQQFFGNCPHCATPLRQERALPVDKNTETITFHIDCVSCKSSILLTIQSGAPGLITTIGMPTDLTKGDLDRMKKTTRAITVDDVLELHTYLEKKK
jgi:hypothetical protein